MQAEADQNRELFDLELKQKQAALDSLEKEVEVLKKENETLGKEVEFNQALSDNADCVFLSVQFDSSVSLNVIHDRIIIPQILKQTGRPCIPRRPIRHRSERKQSRRTRQKTRRRHVSVAERAG